MTRDLGRRAHLWPHEADVEIFEFGEGILIKGFFGFLMPLMGAMIATVLALYTTLALEAGLCFLFLWIFNGEPITSLVVWWLKPVFTGAKLHVSTQRRLVTFAAPIVKETYSFDELHIKPVRRLLVLKGFEIAAADDGRCLARNYFLVMPQTAARIIGMLER